MKILRTALIALVAGTSAAAAQEGSLQERCSIVGELAEAVMSARQSGVIMSTAMGALAADNPFKDLTEMMIKQAYAKPQFQAEENRQQAAIEFRNEMELICYTTD